MNKRMNKAEKNLSRIHHFLDNIGGFKNMDDDYFGNETATESYAFYKGILTAWDNIDNAMQKSSPVNRIKAKDQFIEFNLMIDVSLPSFDMRILTKDEIFERSVKTILDHAKYEEEYCFLPDYVYKDGKLHTENLQKYLLGMERHCEDIYMLAYYFWLNEIEFYDTIKIIHNIYFPDASIKFKSNTPYNNSIEAGMTLVLLDYIPGIEINKLKPLT